MSRPPVRQASAHHDHADPSPPPSSGAITPITASESPGSSFLSSSVGGLFGSLYRRFSSENTTSLSTSTPHTTGSHDSSMLYGSGGPLEELHRSSKLRSEEPPPLEPLTLRGFKDETAAGARLLGETVAEEIRHLIPPRLQLEDTWDLVYSLFQDGASLATLYKNCDAYRGVRVGFVLVVKDYAGGIFGAYLSDAPHIAHGYYGTGECFLWRASLFASLPPPPSADTTDAVRTATIPIASPTRQSHLADTRSEAAPLEATSIRFKAFPYSGVNDYMMLCETGFLSVGGGDGSYGLWLDDSLARGQSSISQTFGNEPLSDQGNKFGILGVELWVVGGKPPS